MIKGLNRLIETFSDIHNLLRMADAVQRTSHGACSLHCYDKRFHLFLKKCMSGHGPRLKGWLSATQIETGYGTALLQK